MLHILVSLLIGVANAHRAFGPATVPAEMATMSARGGPLDADEIERAIAGLDRGIQFASLRLTECGRHLLPDRFRHDSGPYTEFLREYHTILIEWRGLFARMGAGENVPAAELERLRLAHKTCSSRAHAALLTQVR